MGPGYTQSRNRVASTKQMEIFKTNKNKITGVVKSEEQTYVVYFQWNLEERNSQHVHPSP